MFLDRLLTHPIGHESGLLVLLQVLKDPRWMNEAEKFSENLIAHVLKQPCIEEDLPKLVVNVLREKNVEEEVINLAEYILKEKQSEDILAKYLNTVLTRPDVKENLTQLLSESGCHALSDPTTRDQFENMVTNIVSNKSLKEGIMENYVYSPARSFFSFGAEQAE